MRKGTMKDRDHSNKNKADVQTLPLSQIQICWNKSKCDVQKGTYAPATCNQ